MRLSLWFFVYIREGWRDGLGFVSQSRVRDQTKGKKMFDSIAFIGAGRVARILMGGWRHAKIPPRDFIVFDTNPDAVAALQSVFPSVRAASLAECLAADLVFCALHPPATLELLGNVAGQLRASAVFCSLAPKIKLATLQEKLDGFGRLVRMNPNAPSIVGSGYNPVVFAAGLPEPERVALSRLLGHLGQCPEVAEELLETYAVISAMGPTYFDFQFAEVRNLAESFGLSPEGAREALAAMLHGTVDMLFSGTLGSNEVFDLVPVRPMAEHEAEIRQMFRQRLGTIFAKLNA